MRLPDAIRDASLRSGPASLAAAALLAARLRTRRYDTVVLLEHLTTRSGALKQTGLVLATGAPRRIGLDNGRGWFLTHRAVDDGFTAQHEADYWLSVVGLLGADTRPRPTEVPVQPADVAAARDLLRGLRRPLVALHPGSGAYASRARRWDPDRFAEVGRALSERRGASVIVVGNERSVNARVAQSIGARDLSGRTAVGVLAAVLARVDLLVTNDSGVAHVGAAADAPMVAIYGQTDPRAWGPYYGDPARQERAAFVQVPLACRPCLYRGHNLGWRSGCATRDCLELVSAGMVLAAAERQLDAHGAARPEAIE